MTVKPHDAGGRQLPLLLLLAATLLCLVPFCHKAFNIDEPLFIWVARHLQSNPLDFYGFQINWYGTGASAAEIIKNPPLASYYIALAAYLGGWSETSLHLAFLLPALAGVTGTYLLARELTVQPLLAALLALFTPVFITSSATVMCDTMMLAFYVWAVFLWAQGVKRDSYHKLLYASILIALASLTKYFGVSLIPLLLLYTLSVKRARKPGLLFMLVPVAVLGCYQWGTGQLYGGGLLLDAASYAHAQKAHGVQGTCANLVTGLSFLGGSLFPFLLLVPKLWGRVALWASLAGVALLALGLSLLPFPERPEGASWAYGLQLTLAVAAGGHLLALAARDLWQERDADSALLFCWVAGTFIFAAFLNWSINARVMLPLVPAVAILAVRALARRGCSFDVWQLVRSRYLAAALACAWFLSMAVAWSDYALAGTARSAAREISRHYQAGSTPLLFQGHWGFQYYMEQAGALALDGKKIYPRPLIMVMPENNINLGPDIMAKGAPLEVLQFSPLPFLADMNMETGAGFYSSVMGALPFVFGRVPEEKYLVVRLN